jgi:hypothetical protein
MNERIRELAKQAEIKWQHQEDVIYSTMTLEQFEKFSELIVRECATLAFDGPNGILEHFGVEE